MKKLNNDNYDDVMFLIYMDEIEAQERAAAQQKKDELTQYNNVDKIKDEKN